jgi:nitrogen fixation/metabolism regulation signal transduction histidine kinase
VETILRGGKEVTVQIRELVEDRLRRQVVVAADEVRRGGADLARVRHVLGVDLVALYEDGDLVEAVADPRRIPASLPPLRWDDLPADGTRADRWRGGLLIRAWHTPDDGRRVVVADMLPAELLLHLENAIAADAEFQEMKQTRGTITATTVLVLLAITLLLLFATVWVGLFLSRRFTEPLLAVTEATQRVAEGDALEEVEVEVPATDEVAILVDSFNAMVRRVRATEAEILASNQELEALLATVPTGVLSINADGSRFRPNTAAARILGAAAWENQWLELRELDRPGFEELYRRLACDDRDAARFEISLEPDDEATRQIDVTARPLPDGGRVVALDDLTQLIQAQRQAAWREAAQRIAHEIMNPLTPIRLAAERMQRRAESIEGEMGEVVASGCEAIVAQVAGLRELVTAFQEYARLPEVKPRASDVNRLLRELASLYDGVRDGLRVAVDVPGEPTVAIVDPVQLRQALVNLLDNAVAAIPDEGTISLALQINGDNLRIEVADTGRGLPTDDTETLVQPFFSTKGRGSGMGLAMVHRIITDHGGTLELKPSPVGGAIAVVELPSVLASSRSSKP